MALNDSRVALADLRRLVSAAVIPRVRGWRTGIEVLDALLPQGVPRGRVTEWGGAGAAGVAGAAGAVGAVSRTSGKGAALAGLVSAVLSSEEGLGVAYVHTAGTLAPGPWAGSSGAPFWVVRVPDAREGWRATEIVLRMGVFGLVVSEGAPPPNVALRLERLARATDAAWVVVVDRAGTVPGAALRTQFALAGGNGRNASCRVAVRVVERGRTRRAEFPCEIALPDRLCDHTGLPDRRA